MGTEVTWSRPRRRSPRIEGPTWLALVGCYSVWALVLWQAETLGLLAVVPGALAVALHSSLQHEVLHGHPTRSAALNEALIFLPLGLSIPYRRFRDLHLSHHNDARLTDPYDDPESFYTTIGTWWQMHPVAGRLLLWNQTFAGRMILGPALSLWALWRGDLTRWRRGEPRIVGAYLRHAVGLAPVGLAIWASGMSPWLYIFGIAYPAISLVMVRSYIEHHAAEEVTHRTAIVDAHWFWRLLFLNNNYHAVHHTHPTLPWYQLRKRWLMERDDVLARNGQYFIGGYGEVLRRWLFTRREPLVHPFIGHDAPAHAVEARAVPRPREGAAGRERLGRRGSGAI